MYICIEGVDIDNRGVDEESVESVEVVEVLFFDWPAGIVFMLMGGACSVASPLDMAFNHVLMAVESRTSWMPLWGRQ